MLLAHMLFSAFFFAFESAGNSRLASMAIMAMTTKSSIRVKACLDTVFISLEISSCGWAWFSCLTLWANDTEDSQANPSVPDRTGSTRESGETALLS
jgi:hypothetical protein